MAWSKTDRREAVERLRKWLKPGDTVYTDLKHVSRSGMNRTIQCLQLENNEPRWIGYNVAAAIDMPYDREREGVKIGGCGMDMGFAIVNDLSYVLFPEYECLGDHCPSADHVNSRILGEKVPAVHKDGYALKHRWI